MANRIGANGEILPIRGKRGASRLGIKRVYVKTKITKPRRRPRYQPAPVGDDPNEQRAAKVAGSILERIVYKRLTVLVGPQDVGFIYKFQQGAVSGADARAFVGGIEADFIVLNRPDSKGLVLEPQGAQWHGPVDAIHDLDRALIWVGLGYEYAELSEWEIWLGDDYLDERLRSLIGTRAHSRRDLVNNNVREIRPIGERPRDPITSE